MKRIIFAIVFIFIANANLAQYLMSIEKNDNSLVEISTSDISQMTFYSECPGTPTVSYSGKTYNTVYIGTQCWLKENLDVGSITQGSSNQNNNSVIEKYCYDNLESNCTTYGGLYQWNEAMQYGTTAGAQGICPSGWHIPTKGEFETLKAAVNNDGNALKAVGQGTGAGAGENTNGFSLLLGGYRAYDGLFKDLGVYTNLWSSTENGLNYAYYMDLYYSNSSIYLYDFYKWSGHSVRCLKD